MQLLIDAENNSYTGDIIGKDINNAVRIDKKLNTEVRAFFKFERISIIHFFSILFFLLFFSNKEIELNLLLFMLAGYETTSTTLAYSAYVLATLPDEQQKIFEEINNTFDIESNVRTVKIRRKYSANY